MVQLSLMHLFPVDSSTEQASLIISSGVFFHADGKGPASERRIFAFAVRLPATDDRLRLLVAVLFTHSQVQIGSLFYSGPSIPVLIYAT